jgi:hypothetical protein
VANVLVLKIVQMLLLFENINNSLGFIDRCAQKNPMRGTGLFQCVIDAN